MAGLVLVDRDTGRFKTFLRFPRKISPFGSISTIFQSTVPKEDLSWP